MAVRRRRRIITGVVLVVIGLVLFALELGVSYGREVTLLLVGGLFLAGYTYRRLYGLLIFGSILAGLGLGSLVAHWLALDIDFELVGLGLGFIGIYAVDLLGKRSSRRWPVIPGVVLVLYGVVKENASLQRLVENGWPIIIVVAGLVMLLGGVRKRDQ
jgi:hypothetical protein